MATTIKLKRETKLDSEKYLIYKNDWCEHIVTIYNDDSEKEKEDKMQRVLDLYAHLKKSLLDHTMTETLLEDTI